MRTEGSNPETMKQTEGSNSETMKRTEGSNPKMMKRTEGSYLNSPTVIPTEKSDEGSREDFSPFERAAVFE